MDNVTEDLSQDRFYVSSRDGQLEVRRLVVTHAARILAKLEREHGPEVRDAALGRALADRAGRSGTATGVDAIAGDGHMLRGSDGRFVGAWYSSQEAR